LVRRSESALFAIPFLGRLHQRDISIPSVNIQKPIGIGYRSPAETLYLPHHLPRRELNSEHLPPDFRAVKIGPDQHRPPEAVRKAAREVDLLGGDSIAVRL